MVSFLATFDENGIGSLLPLRMVLFLTVLSLLFPLSLLALFFPLSWHFLRPGRVPRDTLGAIPLPDLARYLCLQTPFHFRLPPPSMASPKPIWSLCRADTSPRSFAFSAMVRTMFCV